MRYLLLLLLAVPAAHADDCHGLTPNADFPNVCEPDEFRTNKERILLGTEPCTYSYTSVTGKTIECKDHNKKTKDSKCKSNCDEQKKIA